MAASASTESKQKASMNKAFPNERLWLSLLEHAKSIPEPVLRDNTLDVDVSLSRLVVDVAHMRQVLLDSLPPSLFDNDRTGLISESRPYIGLLVSPNYEFFVGCLAILALGGAIVVLQTENLAMGEFQILKECKASEVVLGKQQVGYCDEIKRLGQLHEHPIHAIPLVTMCDNTETPSADGFYIDQEMTIPSERPSFVMKTTGTTGTARNVVHCRWYWNRTVQASPDDHIILETFGLITPFVAIMLRVLNGSKGEVLSTSPGPEAIWERLKEGSVTNFTCYSWCWEQLARYYQEHLSALPSQERARYVRGAQALKWAYIVGSPSPPWLHAFWKETFGCRLQVGYSATELGVITLATTVDGPYIEVHSRPFAKPQPCLSGSIGKPLPGMGVKLSGGDHGEILVKTPCLFTHYLGDPVRTKAVFDDEGYFRTGDAAHLEDGQYVFDGRIGSDILDVSTGQICFPRLEHKLTNIPYVSEAYMLRIQTASPGEGYQLGVLVRFKDHSHPASLGQSSGEHLEEFKAQLSEALRPHEPPVSIRLLHEGEEIPRTFNMKPFRRIIVEHFFAPQI
ncbi:Uncharacterized protein TCAP_01016 [Tolypocladium capitatum]|uniref:AMP-dependent synthetase/ligase domain-containing protein n=1 Tax=Tolypocladium capitatum TaxID=45235 RepID=A0A2K3QNH3_9HYPO|nr:Uncharacterized protein TCAP_01016 [Tolypocladium capitatum]